MLSNTFNRTIVELKQSMPLTLKYAANTFNRTIVELKLHRRTVQGSLLFRF